MGGTTGSMEETITSATYRAFSHPLYLDPLHRPPLFADPLPTALLVLFACATFLSLSYLSLSPRPYRPLNRLVRLALLPFALIGLSKLFLAHRCGDIEPWNQSGFGAWGVWLAARATIMALGLFGRAGRLRWVGWGWYGLREGGRGYWSTKKGREEAKRFNEEVLRGNLQVEEGKDYPCWSHRKRLGLAALFLLSPRHIGFSTAKPPSSYVTPPPDKKNAILFHLKTFLLASVGCDLVILLYSLQPAFCTFELDPSRRPSLFNPLPRPYPDLTSPLLRALTHTLVTGFVIQSSIGLSHSLVALLSLLLLPSSLSRQIPFPSLTTLNPFFLLSPLPSHRRLAPSSVRAFWAGAWHDLLSLDISLLSFHPFLPFSRPLALLSAFAFSGLLHSVSLHAVALGGDWTRMMSVFLLQGLGLAAESLWEKKMGRRVGGEAGRVWTTVCVGVSGVMLAELFVSRGFLGFRRPFSPLGQALLALGWWPERTAISPWEQVGT
ncbi:hypothetical protein JCM8547_002665 [Rhodosporidiobolus lusitaniae]